MQHIDSKEVVSSTANETILLARKARSMARRRYQKGQLIKDVDRWLGRWREYVLDPETGKERAIRKTQVIASLKECPTERLARRRLDDRLREVNREDYRPRTVAPFEYFAERWMKTVMIHHKASTQASERSHIRVHLIPSFGTWPLQEITTEVLQGWISNHSASPKTVHNIIDTLSVMWTTATDWSYVTHNPIRGLKMPQKCAPKTYAFSLEETLAIIQKAEEPWKTLFRIVAETGIRSGEVAGLRIEDFDPIHLTISVRQSVWNSHVQTPKSTNAIRREAISRDLADAIERTILQAKDRPNEHGLIFAGKTGQPLQMIHFMNRVFRPLLEELGIRQRAEAMGIKQCGLHALRRMNGTQMDEQGVPVATRMDRLGHAHPSTTLVHYTKPIDEASRRFADRMGALLSPKTDAALQ